MTGSGAVSVPPGYRYLRHLGAGGFGDVHLAEHGATGRPVAIKYIQQHLLSDPDVLARFRRESQILAATDVASVVRVYDLDTASDPAYLVMEYVPGVTLWDLMEQAPLPARQALVILRDVAEALSVMAGRGLVHRDIKPSNVFVLPNGRAKLGDFGLARAVADDAGFRTAGAPAGTPAYFPPEVSSGDAEATLESDAYSFAIMVYEALTGSRPITAPDAISLITAHWTQAPRPVTEALLGFPPSAAQVLMAALAKVPAGRPLPHELMAALDAVPAEGWPTNDRPPVPVPDAPPLEGADVGAAEPTVAGGSDPPPLAQLPEERAPVTVASPAPPRAAQIPPAVPATARARRPGARRATVVVLIAVVVIAASIGAVWRLQDDPAPAPEAPALAVTTVALTADPAAARCPGATVVLVATVGTNGSAGSLTVAWTLPDGSPGPEQAFAVEEGQREIVARLDTTFTGDNPVDGQAGALVEPSGLRATTPVTYRCAGGSGRP